MEGTIAEWICIKQVPGAAKQIGLEPHNLLSATQTWKDDRLHNHTSTGTTFTVMGGRKQTHSQGERERERQRRGRSYWRMKIYIQSIWNEALTAGRRREKGPRVVSGQATETTKRESGIDTHHSWISYSTDRHHYVLYCTVFTFRDLEFCPRVMNLT